jgi:TPR repeat protein
MHQRNNNYYLGLLYCVCNDIDKAYFYLDRAAKKGNKAAEDTLQELKEKNVLPIHIKRNDRGFVEL